MFVILFYILSKIGIIFFKKLLKNTLLNEKCASNETRENLIFTSIGVTCLS
jgi:hypothetical protein